MRRLEGDYRLLNKCFADLENLFTIWNEPNMQSYEQMVLPLVTYLTNFLKEEVKKATSGSLLKMSGLEPSSDNAESAMDIDLDEVGTSHNKSSMASVPFAESSEKVCIITFLNSLKSESTRREILFPEIGKYDQSNNS